MTWLELLKRSPIMQVSDKESLLAKHNSVRRHRERLRGEAEVSANYEAAMLKQSSGQRRKPSNPHRATE